MSGFLVIFLAIVATQVLGIEAAKVSDAPKLVELVDELNIPEDTNATITCSVGSGQLDGLTYEWFKDKERVYTNSASRIRIDIPADNYQSALRIFNLNPKDSALYTCIAKNRFGQDKISTKLNVQVQLKWTAQPSDLQAPVGSQVYVPCKANGSPEPTIEWTKINEQSTDTERYGSELRFTPVSQRDAGLYECRARNGADEDLTTRIKLDVLDFSNDVEGFILIFSKRVLTDAYL